MKMKKNVGPNERYWRFGIGVAAASAAALVGGLGRWRIPLAIVGASQMISGATRYSLLNAMLRMDNTRPMERLQEEAEEVTERAQELAGV
ncbi:MAG TPA: DUF2892 domain-containing protein [Planctomycetota bacterium]|nr:DUF2892 domain-containing protein [Planctomycetota bacterium]